MEHQDLTTLSWNDKLWLSYFPLNADTVLEYFSRAPFYSRSCLNEQYKMQRLELSAFENVPGVLYEVQKSLCVEPSLFVIAKLERSESLEVSTLAYYYILNGTAFQAPRVSSVLTTRMVQSMSNLKDAFRGLQEKVPTEDGDWFAWVPQSSLSKGSGTTGDESEVASRERQTVDRLLYGILERNRRVMKDAVKNEEVGNGALQAKGEANELAPGGADGAMGPG